MLTVINIFLIILGSYFALGFLFGVYFIIKAPKIDPLLGDSKKGVRFLLFPGVIATWPHFAIKLVKNKTS